MAATQKTAPKTKHKPKAAVETVADDYAITDETQMSEDVNDPLENFNRAIYKFNNTVDNLLFKPTARVYRGVVPAWGRKRVSNALENLSEPVTLLNSTLQGDAHNAFTAFWRFIINSTFGVAGMFDAASEVGLAHRREDFGQTLGVWGVKSGPYIVLPIIGPSNTRDSVGRAVDFFTNPFNRNYLIEDEKAQIALYITDYINKRANLLDLTDDIEKNALDPYATFRSTYLQYRRSAIQNGKLKPFNY